jgi:hypothetical protein
MGLSTEALAGRVEVVVWAGLVGMTGAGIFFEQPAIGSQASSAESLAADRSRKNFRTASPFRNASSGLQLKLIY